MSARDDRYRISVPASSANLGPGFDCAALALALYMHATVEPAPRLRISFDDAGEAPSHDGLAALMIRAMREIHAALPAIHVHVRNEIPLGKGLGSSAAAVVIALVAAARARGKQLSFKAVGRIASSIEGHPDNALAAALGGAIVAANGERFFRFACSPLIRPLLIVPEIELDTHSARLLLPPSYDRADVVFTAQRAALLGASLASGEVRLLREAMSDRIHQPYRAARIPGLPDVLAVRDRDLAGIALSGAGPSVIALVREGANAERVASKMQAAFAGAGVASRALPLQFSRRGVRIRASSQEAAHAA